MRDTRQNHPLADRRPRDRGRLSLAEAQRLEADARRLQGAAIAAALRGAATLLVGGARSAVAFVRCAAIGQAKRLPSPAECG